MTEKFVSDDAESQIEIFGSDKSFVDDLNIEQGAVSEGVALCHDPLRLCLCSLDLFINKTNSPTLNLLNNQCDPNKILVPYLGFFDSARSKKKGARSQG